MDTKFTAQIQYYLATPREERDVAEGAEMMLKLNRNRILYANILRNPEKMAAKLEYELNKFLRIRLDGMTMHEVAVMNETVVPAARESIAAGIPEGFAPIPTEAPEEDEFVPEEMKDAPIIDADNDPTYTAQLRGRRADHANLPAEIQAIYNENGDRYFRIKMIFNELLGMENACLSDRYERLQILKKLDEDYRAAWVAYDHFKLGDPLPIDEEPQPLDAKTVSAARKYLSTNLPKLEELIALDEAKASALREKMQERVNTLIEAQQTFDAEHQARMEAAGLSFE